MISWAVIEKYIRCTLALRRSLMTNHCLTLPAFELNRNRGGEIPVESQEISDRSI